MGRKVDMKKIEDITKCQVTFSKRRSSLIKKAEEISICCDVDIALIAFSPSGRVSKFCNHRRIEHVLNRFVNQPADRRLLHIQNVQGKLEKLQQLDNIMSDASKLHFLDKQIENLELQIKKSTLEMQILEADLRDYEPDPEQDPSLHQLLWCQINLKQSLERVITKKNALYGGSSSAFAQGNNVQKDSFHDMGNQDGILSSYNSAGNRTRNELINSSENTSTGQLLMQLDPWTSPYSAKASEKMFKGLADQGRSIAASNIVAEASHKHTSIRGSQMSQQSIDDQALLESRILSHQNNLNRQVGTVLPIQQQSTFEQMNSFLGRNNPTITNFGTFPPQNIDRMPSGQMYAPLFCNVTTTTTRAGAGPRRDNFAVGYVQTRQNLVEHSNPNSVHSSLAAPNLICVREDLSSDLNHNDNNNSSSNRNEVCSTAMYHVDPTPATTQDTMFCDLPVEDDAIWNSAVQENGTCDWKDLLSAHNLDVEDFDML